MLLIEILLPLIFENTATPLTLKLLAILVLPPINNWFIDVYDDKVVLFPTDNWEDKMVLPLTDNIELSINPFEIDIIPEIIALLIEIVEIVVIPLIDRLLLAMIESPNIVPAIDRVEPPRILSDTLNPALIVVLDAIDTVEDNSVCCPTYKRLIDVLDASVEEPLILK